MTAIGQERRFGSRLAISALPPRATELTVGAILGLVAERQARPRPEMEELARLPSTVSPSSRGVMGRFGGPFIGHSHFSASMLAAAATILYRPFPAFYMSQ
jgi:hypothetical protein